MAIATKEFFINLRKEIESNKEHQSGVSVIGNSCQDLPLPPEGDLLYDELLQQNIELSNEIAILKKDNYELQNRLDVMQSANQGEANNVVSFETFIRYIKESNDDDEVKAAKHLGTIFFDGECKIQIYKAANERLAQIKPSTTNVFQNKVGQVAERITNKLE